MLIFGNRYAFRILPTNIHSENQLFRKKTYNSLLNWQIININPLFIYDLYLFITKSSDVFLSIRNSMIKVRKKSCLIN